MCMWIACISHNEELCNLYRTFRVVTIVKCRKMQCAGYGGRWIQYNMETCDLFRSPGVVRTVECRRLG
jgi:hypothetical protein